ncbi:Gene Transfer Agent (GTA) ORFG06 [Rhodovulum sp. PH10]|uniref:head-tail connector protein n=1 Tax=Rhodovulum sp. PH10 TaxID=1187851 RepID=UPI00027C26D5|nr:head-tail connector protein [Rhodovulum sp. PH10]EJW10149.1 Gene Transfer Agent (GTA) ORFG06 [Rhodovulum sp. PH10]
MAMLLQPPAAEPLSLAEAKLVLRVEHDTDDDLIATLIAAARRHVEAVTRRALLVQTWRLARDAWPASGRIAVLPAPLRTVVAARVFDAAGTARAIDPEIFTLDPTNAPGVIAVAPHVPRAPGRRTAGIEIDVSVGYGETAAEVPAPLVQAVRMLLAHWYANRAVVAETSAQPLPLGVAALLAPWRVLLP